MFPNKKPDYSQISLDDFSDDDSSGDEEAPQQHRQRRRPQSVPTNSNTIQNDDEKFRQSSRQRQELMMKEQDQGLEMLSQSAIRLGDLSMAISEELGQQNKWLDEMDKDLDEEEENLDFVTRKTKEFIKESGGTKNCIVIVTLAVIAIVLFFLILYT